MPTRIWNACLVACLVAGCADEGPGVAQPRPWMPPTIRPPMPGVPSAFDRCLDEGGALTETDVIDNRVVVDHGELVTVAMSSDGQIAVGSTDGSIKLWTIAARSGATITGPSSFGYDRELGAGSPIVRTIAYAPDATWLAAGNTAGTVSLFRDTGESMRTFPGTTELASVSVSPDGASVAFADAAASGAIRIGSVAEGGVDGPIATGLTRVSAIAYLPSGALVTAGERDGAPLVEMHAVDDPTEIVGQWTDAALVGAGVREIALTAEGDRVVAVGAGFVVILDPAAPATPIALARDAGYDPSSVALTPGQGHFVTVGAAGEVRVYATSDAEEVGRFVQPRAVAARVDPRSSRVVIADTDAFLHLFGCAAP